MARRPSRNIKPGGQSGSRAQFQSATTSVMAGPAPTWQAALLIIVGCVVYANSLSGPFIFDDEDSIVGNQAIRSLGSVLSERHNSPLAGRPLIGLSFAFNYLIGGLDVRGYHAVNVAIHIGCALLLLGIVRQTLTLSRLQARFGAVANPIALAVALVWLAHPLNTEAVNYLTERTESLMALFYLMTLYASIRGHRSKHREIWQALAVAACSLGMACKESMVTAPLMVVLYDRIFMFDSLHEAVSRRWRLYAALALTWVILLYLILPGPRSGSAGFSADVHPWTYLMNQAAIVIRYFRLAIWPVGLVVQYGPPLPLTLGDVLPQATVLVLLILATLAALRWRPAAGFLGAWVFVTLAPASSLVPIATEVGAERRMYLPLMGILTLLIAGLYGLTSVRTRIPSRAATAALVAVVLALGAATMARNSDYRSGLSLAYSNLDHWPTDLAHGVVGSELARARREAEAIPELQIGARDDPRSRYNLGVALFNQKRFEEAIKELAVLVDRYPMREEVPWSRRIMGHSFARLQRWQEAIDELRLSLSMAPADGETRKLLVDALNSQGIELGSAGRHADATAAFQRALDLDSNNALIRHNLATALLDSGNVEGALAEARHAVALDPTDAGSHNLIGRALALQGSLEEAIVQLEQAVRLRPDDPSLREDLAKVRTYTAKRW